MSSSTPCCPAPPSTRSLQAGSRLRAVFRKFVLAIAVRAERRALMSLDDAALKIWAFTAAWLIASMAAPSGTFRWIGCATDRQPSTFCLAGGLRPEAFSFSDRYPGVRSPMT